MRLLVLAGLLSCAGDGETSTVEPGVLFEQNLATIDAPSPTTAPFDVLVTTWGNSCTSVESTITTATNDGVIIAPYDRHLMPAGAEQCLQNLERFVHKVTLSLPAGSWTLHVQGHDAQLRAVEVPVPIVVE